MGNATTLSMLNQLAFNGYVGQWLVFAVKNNLGG